MPYKTHKRRINKHKKYNKKIKSRRHHKTSRSRYTHKSRYSRFNRIKGGAWFDSITGFFGKKEPTAQTTEATAQKSEAPLPSNNGVTIPTPNSIPP